MYLNCHSYFSLKYGTISEEELVDMAVRYGIRRLALTDINNTSACINFSRLAEKAGICPVIGVDFRGADDQTHYIALAKNNEGYRQICAYLSHHLHTKKAIEAEAIFTEDVWIVYPYGREPRRMLLAHELIGVRPQDLNKLVHATGGDYGDSFVALQTVSFRDKRDYNTHRLLRAMDQNLLLSQADPGRNASPADLFYTPEQIRHMYRAVPELIYRADEVLESCEVDFGWGCPKNLKTYSGSKVSDYQLIRQACKDGLRYRYGTQVPHVVYHRLEHELRLIQEQDFVSYFLISWDIVHHALAEDFYYVGRGSGANSLVAYLLRITDVDPIELNLYFERFINLFRTSPPDFDIDFSWRDRDRMYSYIFERFDHVALLGVYSTFQYRAAIREMGKVFGLPKSEMDKLTSRYQLPKHPDKLQQYVLQYSKRIQNYPSHLSIHAGGVLIADQDIHYHTATFLPPKNLPVTQFDMVVAEDIGLHKFDILSQRGLGKIKEAMSIIQSNHPKDDPIDIRNLYLFKHDPKVKQLLRQARAIGCFYVESPAMRMLLTKLQVDDYLGLVAASSVIRPGVAKSGMMRAYILRHRYPERRKDAPPVMMEIMPETYGVMVYQEDVIKVAHYYGGLTLAEADVLRRGMSGKYRSRDEFRQVRQKFFDNCHQRSYDPSQVTEIWRQIESFAGYAFAKGHSASYAVESYQSLYLKAHYPLEYLVAVINNHGGFYSTAFYIHEARMWGGVIHAPDINKSHYKTRIYDRDIYLGYALLRDLQQGTIRHILDARAQGLFVDLDDFLDRVSITIEQISILIRIDAFRFTGIHKRKLLWEAHLKISKEKNPVEQPLLFRPERNRFQLPDLTSTQIEDAFDQMELLGFSLISPFMLLEHPPPVHICVKQMKDYLGKHVRMVGELVTVKNTKTTNGKLMQFGTFIDIQGALIDTVHFPNVTASAPFRGKGIYALTGKVTEEFGHYALEITSVKKLAFVQDPRYVSKPKTTQI